MAIQFKKPDNTDVYLIPSGNIKVIPCSTRNGNLGEYGDTESRMQTELTVTNHYSHGLQGLNNYIINLTKSTTSTSGGTTTYKADGTLEFSIHGYYFKITGLTVDEDNHISDFYINGNYLTYAVIKLDDWQIFSDETKSKRLVKVCNLPSTSDNNTLDCTIDETSYFCGIGFATTVNAPDLTGRDSLALQFGIHDANPYISINASKQIKFDADMAKTVGHNEANTAQPVYLDNGEITAITANIGQDSENSIRPVYVSAGVITQVTKNVGGDNENAIKPVYVKDGAITAISKSSGSASRPVYINQGQIKPITLSTASGNADGVVVSNTGTNTSLSVKNLQSEIIINSGALISKITESKTGEVGAETRALTVESGTAQGHIKVDGVDGVVNNLASDSTPNFLTVGIGAENQRITLETQAGTTNGIVKLPKQSATLATTADIDALDVATIGINNGYIKSVGETNGKIYATTASFDPSVPSSEDSASEITAPTTKAVRKAINNLNRSQIGSTGSYILHVGENSGIIYADTKSFDSSLGMASSNNAPTTAAVKTVTDTLMTKANPTGSGSLSINRKSDTTIGSYSVSVGTDTIATGFASFAEGSSIGNAPRTITITGTGNMTNEYTVTTSSYSSAIIGCYYYNSIKDIEVCLTNKTASLFIYKLIFNKAFQLEDGETVYLSLLGGATGNHSHAEGAGAVAAGAYSHAEGNSTIASGDKAHAEGYATEAYGIASHAEGNYTRANGENSHAEGSRAYADGIDSHAEGYSTAAGGAYSHAEGYYTTAQKNSQHVFGKYNISDTENNPLNIGSGYGRYVEIVGNGTAITDKSNARTLDWNGNEILSGGLTVGGDIMPAADAVQSGNNFTGIDLGASNYRIANIYAGNIVANKINATIEGTSERAEQDGSGNVITSTYLPRVAGSDKPLTGTLYTQNIYPNQTTTESSTEESYSLGDKNYSFKQVVSREFLAKNKTCALDEVPAKNTWLGKYKFIDKTGTNMGGISGGILTDGNATELGTVDKDKNWWNVRLVAKGLKGATHEASFVPGLYSGSIHGNISLGTTDDPWKGVYSNSAISITDTIPNFNAIMADDDYSLAPSTMQSAQYLARDKNGQFIGGVRVYHNSGNKIQTQLLARSANTEYSTFVMLEQDANATSNGANSRFLPAYGNATDLGGVNNRWKDLHLSSVRLFGATVEGVCDTAATTAAKEAKVYTTETTISDKAVLAVWVRNSNTKQSALTLTVKNANNATVNYEPGNGQPAVSINNIPIYINNVVSSNTNYTLNQGWHVFYFDASDGSALKFYVSSFAIAEFSGGITMKNNDFVPAKPGLYNIGTNVYPWKNLYSSEGHYQISNAKGYYGYYIQQNGYTAGANIDGATSTSIPKIEGLGSFRIRDGGKATSGNDRWVAIMEGRLTNYNTTADIPYINLHLGTRQVYDGTNYREAYIDLYAGKSDTYVSLDATYVRPAKASTTSLGTVSYPWKDLYTQKLVLNSGTTAKAHLIYNATTDSIDFVF